MTRYLRCPYAFYLLDRGLIDFDETVSASQLQMIRAGTDFQNRIEAELPELRATPDELPRIFASKTMRLFGAPVLENAELEIFGQPDAIDTAAGELIPIEAKAHKHVQTSDELELAFYWLLLEPYRTRVSAPAGRLLLRNNDRINEVYVELRPHHFERVRRLLAEVRNARFHGVSPRICPCTVCRGVARAEIERVTSANKDLSRIWGIGPAFAKRFEEIGITSYDGLIEIDATAIVQKFRERGGVVGVKQVNSWKEHAKSYASMAPVLFGPPLTLVEPYLVLDLEYLSPGALVWLIGACIVRPDGREYVALWSENPDEERASLGKLVRLAEEHPAVPIVTWNGIAADFPKLREAFQRHDFGAAMAKFDTRHLDLFAYSKISVRFPVPGLRLGDVADYFAIPRVSPVQDGLIAQGLYYEYAISRNSNRRNEIKAALIEYNRDDLAALASVAERIVSIQSS